MIKISARGLTISPTSEYLQRVLAEAGAGIFIALKRGSYWSRADQFGRANNLGKVRFPSQRQLSLKLLAGGVLALQFVDPCSGPIRVALQK